MTIIPWYLEVDEVLRLAKEGASVRTIAAQTGIGKSTVSRIIRGERVWDRRAGNGANGENNQLSNSGQKSDGQ